jgi:hypothetical protein
MGTSTAAAPGRKREQWRETSSMFLEQLGAQQLFAGS